MEKALVYLGPEGSYTEVAAEGLIQALGVKIFKKVVKNSIISVINEVDRSDNTIGVVPIENSIEGIVRETLDNLVRTETQVIATAEIVVPISHCLISKSKSLDHIEKITSIPQALAQCRHYIEKTLPDAQILTSTSTSEAVKQLSNLSPGHAAIGSARAARIYGFNILDSNINDEKDNFTRFIVLGTAIPPVTGNDKTSIAFTVQNRPGALVELLSVFRENNINLSYIESRPARRVLGDYRFFIDFEGHIQEENVRRTVEKIRPFVSFYRFLGSYKSFSGTR